MRRDQFLADEKNPHYEHLLRAFQRKFLIPFKVVKSINIKTILKSIFIEFYSKS